MKNILYSITVCLVLLPVFSIGCQKEDKFENSDGESVQYIKTFYSAEFDDAFCSLQNVSTTDKKVNLVITNQVDFEKYMSCDIQPPVIDFEKYFILTGVYKHNQCAVFDSQQVYICNNKIIYNVKMLRKDCQAITSLFYVAAIEKNTLISQ